MAFLHGRQAFYVYLAKRWLLVFALITVGCSAQSPSQSSPAAPLDQPAAARLKRIIRSHFEVAPNVDIVVGTRTASDFAGYDALPVTLSDGAHSKVFDFLISSDGTKLMRKGEIEEAAGWQPGSGVGNSKNNEVGITKSYRFLVSRDGRKLMRINLVDDPMEKISLTRRPSRGASDAPITIVVYDDFQCPYCRQNHEELFGEIMREYGTKARVYYKDYPLFEIHPWAGHAAVDANCLAAQSSDAYWEFADYVHPHAKEVSGQDRPVPEQWAALDKIVTDIGQRRNLNGEQLAACLKAQDDSAVRASVKEADTLGVNATPTMFINGEKTEGIVPAEQLRAMLDRDLRDAGQEPPAHAKAPSPAEQSKAAPPATKP
jgi:protein-disulfide isomerase